MTDTTDSVTGSDRGTLTLLISVQGEKRYGAALSPNDPTVQRLAKDRGVPKDKINDLLDTVTSLQLFVKK